MFIVGRVIAGLGAAGSLQGALSIIGYAVELKDRPLRGIVVSVFVISTCMGTVLGGVFTDRYDLALVLLDVSLPKSGASVDSPSSVKATLDSHGRRRPALYWSSLLRGK